MSLGPNKVENMPMRHAPNQKISYHIRAIISYRTDDCPEAQTLESWKEVWFMPITEIQPPTSTEDFPAEFIESQTQQLRISLFGGPAYIITLSTT